MNENDSTPPAAAPDPVLAEDRDSLKARLARMEALVEHAGLSCCPQCGSFSVADVQADQVTTRMQCQNCGHRADSFPRWTRDFVPQRDRDVREGASREVRTSRGTHLHYANALRASAVQVEAERADGWARQVKVYRDMIDEAETCAGSCWVCRGKS